MTLRPFIVLVESFDRMKTVAARVGGQS